MAVGVVIAAGVDAAGVDAIVAAGVGVAVAGCVTGARVESPGV